MDLGQPRALTHAGLTIRSCAAERQTGLGPSLAEMAICCGEFHFAQTEHCWEGSVRVLRCMSAWAHLIRQPCIGVYLKEVALVVNDTGPLGSIAVVIHLHMPCQLGNVSSASPD